jgi:DNA polymerase III subunit delta
MAALLAEAGRAGALPRPVWLVHGDLVLAEPAAERLAAALAAVSGAAAETYRRPPSLAPLLADLRTFSLFVPAKVVLAVDTAVLADRGAAAQLVDDAREALPLPAGFDDRPLTARERLAASRLLQALRLFDVDPEDGPAAAAIGRLPEWALEGGKGGGRKRRASDELRAGLAALLEGARREGMRGWGSGDLAELSDVVQGGLPPGHALVLAERTVAAGHPLLVLLEERGAVAQLAELESARGGAWEGLSDLAQELERQTGVAIARDALDELARRTLRQAGDARKGGGSQGARAESSARFAGEYRKLANLARGEAARIDRGGSQRIDRRLVEGSVEDRGEEDVWQLMDAVALGRSGEALDRLRRLLAGADDPLQARLAFFGLFASFCRQLTAIRGMMRVARVPQGEENYSRFKARWAPALQGELALPEGKGKNPLAGLHPFRLHRAYLAASRLPERFLARLPADVLDAELRLKGESGEADAALAEIVVRVAAGR